MPGKSPPAPSFSNPNYGEGGEEAKKENYGEEEGEAKREEGKEEPVIAPPPPSPAELPLIDNI